jgi:hypothetical protein
MTHWRRGLRGGVASGGRGGLRGSLGKEGEGRRGVPHGNPRQRRKENDDEGGFGGNSMAVRGC